MTKILIIEDDYELASGIARILADELYTVEISTRGQEGIEKLFKETFDAIILDIGLPDVDGFSICSRFRESGGSTAILMLTGKDHVNDRVTGLNLGADDYLVKPFSTRELSARLKALLRRPQQVISNILIFGNVELNLTSHKVTKSGQVIALLPIDYAVLEFLMKHPNEIHSCEKLMTSVWSADKFPTENAVRLSIKRLRQALDDTSSTEQTETSGSIIENVSKAGYRIRQK